MKRIDRIKLMEEKFDKALKAVADLDIALENREDIAGLEFLEQSKTAAGDKVSDVEYESCLSRFINVIPEMDELIAYYESDLWRRDFIADSEGKIPADLKRGVLSEDGIYNLLTDYQRIKELLG